LPSTRPALLFVYNADSGLFNTMADAAHKIFSPGTYACNLCRVTYGWFSERAEWRRFIASIDADCEFLHRDQARARFPGLDPALPAVFRLDDGHPEVCIDAEGLDACYDLDALIERVRGRCLPAKTPTTGVSDRQSGFGQPSPSRPCADPPC
jgi:hypothetical protein